MSIRDVDAVMERSRSRGVQRNVLLAFAYLTDRGKGDGEAWVCAAYLGRRANCPRESASRAIKALMKAGELIDTERTVIRHSRRWPVLRLNLPEVEEADTTVTPRHGERDATSRSREEAPCRHVTPTVMLRHGDRDATSHNPGVTGNKGEESASLPAHVDPEENEEAIREWLIELDAVTRGKARPKAEMETTIVAYTRRLKFYPIEALRHVLLEKSRTWFPDVAELQKELDAYTVPKNARSVPERKAAPVEKWRQYTPEQVEQARAECPPDEWERLCAQAIQDSVPGEGVEASATHRWTANAIRNAAKRRPMVPAE